MTEMELYWITRAAAAHSVLEPLTIFSGAVFVLLLLALGVAYINSFFEDVPKECCRHLLRVAYILGVVFVLFLLAFVLTPSRNDILLIKGFPALTNSKIVQELFPKVVDRLIKEVEKKDESQVSSSKR